MVDLLLLLLGLVAGFVGSRAARTRTARAGGPAAHVPPVGSAAAVASAARTVGGSLGRRKGLTPPELQRACFGELVRHIHRNRKGPTVVPGRFLLDLHPDDLATVDESRTWFTDGLVDALRDAAAQNGWVIEGDVTIVYQSDPSRRPGVPAAHPVGATSEIDDAEPIPMDGEIAGAEAPPAEPDQPAPPTGWRLVRDDTGAPVELDPNGPIVIGRSQTCDVVVDDNRVSRQHLRIEPRQGGGWSVVDLGSSNGSLLDGRSLTPHTARRIEPGSALQVGPVRFTLEVRR